MDAGVRFYRVLVGADTHWCWAPPLFIFYSFYIGEKYVFRVEAGHTPLYLFFFPMAKSNNWFCWAVFPFHFYKKQMSMTVFRFTLMFFLNLHQLPQKWFKFIFFLSTKFFFFLNIPTNKVEVRLLIRLCHCPVLLTSRKWYKDVSEFELQSCDASAKSACQGLFFAFYLAFLWLLFTGFCCCFVRRSSSGGWKDGCFVKQHWVAPKWSWVK